MPMKSLLLPTHNAFRHTVRFFHTTAGYKIIWQIRQTCPTLCGRFWLVVLFYIPLQEPSYIS